jgi:hypothetical protein
MHVFESIGEQWKSPLQTGVENSLELWSKSSRENAFSSREVSCLELFTEPDK